jgi:hypothetical protein
MDVVERGQISLRKVNKFWHVLVTSLSDHLNEKTKAIRCVHKLGG